MAKEKATDAKVHLLGDKTRERQIFVYTRSPFAFDYSIVNIFAKPYFKKSFIVVCKVDGALLIHLESFPTE